MAKKPSPIAAAVTEAVNATKGSPPEKKPKPTIPPKSQRDKKRMQGNKGGGSC